VAGPLLLSVVYAVVLLMLARVFVGPRLGLVSHPRL